jgi:hypothetical protein
MGMPGVAVGFICFGQGLQNCSEFEELDFVSLDRINGI